MTTRKMLTTPLAALTAGALALTLAACSQPAGDESSPTAEETSAQDDATQDADAQESGEPAESEEPTETEEPADAPEGDLAALCAAGDSMMGMASIDTSDPDAALAQLESLSAELDAVEPPADIAADWELVATTFRDYSDTLARISADPAAEGAMEDLSAAMSTLTGEEFTAAGTAIGTYTAENC